jgi:hypothetical protein
VARGPELPHHLAQPGILHSQRLPNLCRFDVILFLVNG